MYKCLNANSTLPKKGNTEQRAKIFLSSGATTHKQTLSPKRNFWKSYRLVKNGFHVNGPRRVDAYGWLPFDIICGPSKAVQHIQDD